MKRKRFDPERRLDNNFREVMHEQLFKCIIAHVYIKQLDLPFELQCSIIYYLKLLTRLTFHHFTTFNTTLSDFALKNGLKDAFPESFLTSIIPTQIGERFRFMLFFEADRKNILHITVYHTGSVIIQGKDYTTIKDMEHRFHCLLDPWYLLYLRYKDWRPSFIK